MKLKYKKIILLTAMSTMGIGLLTLSISQDRPEAKEKAQIESAEASSLLSGNEGIRMYSAIEEENEEAVPSVIPTSMPTLTPTPIPSPTPIPVYNLEKNKEIDALFEDYYAAKSVSDIDKIKSLCSDPTRSETLEQLQSKVKYIEEYRNIKSYSKKGIEAGTYITYVYHEVKFTGINTPAPGLAKFYLVTDAQGNLQLFSGEMDSILQEYFDERNLDEDVLEIIKMTEDKGEKAKASDQDLKIFWEGLDSLTNNSQDAAVE